MITSLIRRLKITKQVRYNQIRLNRTFASGKKSCRIKKWTSKQIRTHTKWNRLERCRGSVSYWMGKIHKILLATYKRFPEVGDFVWVKPTKWFSGCHRSTLAAVFILRNGAIKRLEAMEKKRDVSVHPCVFTLNF